MRIYSEAEELAMFEKYAQTKDIDIRNEIVLNNLNLVHFIARSYLIEGIEFDDLIQAGHTGLIEAVKRFDPKRGFKFSTYAVHWIKNGMLEHISAYARAVRLPAKIQDDLVRIRKTMREYESEFGEMPSEAEIAEKTGLTESRVHNCLSASGKSTSLNALVGEDTELGDLIADDKPAIEETFEADERAKIICKAVNTLLSDKEKFVITNAFGLFGSEKMKLGDIAKILKVSPQRIHNIKATAIAKLKAGLERWGYGL